MNQKCTEGMALSRHQYANPWQNTFGEVLNPPSLKNKSTNSACHMPGFSLSLCSRVLDSERPRLPFRESRGLCLWRVTAEAADLCFHRGLHEHTSAHAHLGKGAFTKQARSKGQSCLMLSPLSTLPLKILIIPTGHRSANLKLGSGGIF